MLPLPSRAARLVLIGAALGGALPATACRSSSGATAPMTLLTVPVVTTVAPLTQSELQSVVVQPGDLPAGWKAVPAGPSPAESADHTAFTQCVGEADTAGDRLARADRSYASAAAVIASTATTFRSASDVQADNAALTSPKAADCLASVVRARWTALLPKGATLKTVTEKITPGANGGPAAVVATVVGTTVFASAGRTLTLNSEVVYLATSKLEAQLVFSNAAGPISAPLVADVIQKVAARLPTDS